MGYYPVFLNLEGRRCVVIGGGPVGERKVRSLLDHGAALTLVSPRATPRLAALAADGRITWERREYQPGDLAGAALAFAATGDPAVDAAVYAEASAAGIWLNVADDPRHCTFILPARVERGELTIAIATGGGSPALARRLGERLRAEFGPEYGHWLAILARLRKEVRTAIPSSQARRAFLTRLVDDPQYLEFLRAGREDQVWPRLRQELASFLSNKDQTK